MLYPDFKRAATKHYETCQCIVKILDEEEYKRSKNHLLSNLFYLSGYIIELIFKYRIYKSINYAREKPIEKLDQDNLSFQQDIKHHALQKLIRILLSKNDISNLESSARKVIGFAKWDVQLRYTPRVELEELEIKKFFEFSKKLYLELSIY